MGMISPSIASNPTSQNVGKGGSSVTPTTQPTSQPPIQFQGKSGMSTNSATSGQPKMGDPSQIPEPNLMYQPQRNFPNTIQQGDNTSNTTNQPMTAGKGKGV
jgi:hypothetical protein